MQNDLFDFFKRKIIWVLQRKHNLVVYVYWEQYPSSEKKYI